MQMKKQKSKTTIIAIRISEQNAEMIRILKEKHSINLSALVRLAIEQKYKELESK
jgi:post-segregation antitoxin (ccd killing protein)